MSDLNTEIKIGADASGVEAGVSKAKRSLKDLGDAAQKAGKDAGAGIGSIGAGGDKSAKDVERATKNMQGSLQRLLAEQKAGAKGSREYYEALADTRGIKRSLKDLGDAAQKAGKDAGAGIGSIGAGGDKSAKDVERATKNMQGSLQRLLAEQKAGAKGSREYYEALADTRGISRNAIKPILDQIDAAKSKTLQAKNATDSWTSSLGKVGPMVAVAFSGAAITGFLGKVVSVQREFDVLNSSLKTVTGSSAAAEREMAWLKDFAKETPFGLAQATQGFVKMKALGLDPTRAALTSFGNTASAMGKDLNQMIEAVADASTGEFERLKEFGIKAKKEGDNVSLTFQGVTTTIGNSAREITKYLEDIGNTSFGGAMEERAKTLDGTIAALGDTWDELFRTVSTNNVGGLIFDSVTLANGALEDATTILKAMGGAAQEAGKGTGALVTIQDGLATVFETVAVVGANVKYVLTQVGNELGGLAAQVAQAAQFNFSGVAAIRTQMVADAQAARREIDATTARILNARKAQEEYARFATRNASAATDPRRIDLGGASVAAARAASAGVSKAVKEAASEYDKLIQKLGEELPKAAAEAEAAQMGYNKSQAEFLALAGSPAWAKFTNEQRASVATLFEAKIASEQAGAAEKLRTQTLADLNKTLEAYAKANQEGVAQSIQAATQAEAQLAQYGLLKSEVQGLTLAYLEQSRESAALAGEDVSNIDKRIAAQKRLIAATRGLEAREISDTAAKEAAADWKRTAESIEQSLTDSLLRGFESGKGFAKNFVDTMKNLFNTLVLRPIISAIVSPVAGAITGGLGLAGTASAATSTVGAIGSGASLLGSAGSLLGGAGTAAGYGFSALMSGNGLGALSGGLGMLTSGGPAAIMAQGAGMIAGVLGPIALGIGALTAIIGKTKGETRTGGQFGVAFDGAVTNNRRDQTYTVEGQQFDRDFTNGLQTALRDGLTYRLEGDPVAQEGAIKAAVSGTASGINGILKALGSEARLAGFSAGLETSGKGRGGVFAGGSFADGRSFGESGKGDNYQGTLYEKFSTNSPDFKAALENFTLDLKQSTIQALQTVTDIPKSVKSLLDGVDAEGLADDAANALLESINAQIVGVDQLKQAFSTIGFDKLADMSFDAATGLAAASGGFDKLIANLDTYYSNFFTAEEQRAQIQKNLQQSFASLDLPLPDIDAKDARAQFRAIVEGAQRDLSESGQKTYAALLQMSGSFAQITPEAAAVVQAVNAISQAMQRLTGDTANLQIELLQAQGRESDALALRREIETQGFNAAEVAAYDYNQSLRASITATNAASAALKAYKTAASSISTSKDTLAGIVRSPVEIAQNALNQTLLRLNETLKPANVVKDDYTYFTLYQDVLDFWKSESGKGGALAGVSAEEYAQIHYESSGKSEGRMSPQEALDLITTLVPNYNPLTLEDVLKLDTSGQGGYSAEQWEVIADVFAKAANVKLAAETPVTPATSVVDTSNAALSDILQERMTLQERYDALTMTSTQLLEKQRNALHESNRALFDSIQIEERKAVVAAERKGLQDQYDELTLTSAQLLERQRDALDESNRALFDSIQTIKSEAKAREEAVKALGDSYDGVQRAVDAQRKIYQVARDAAQESVSEITSVFDILKSSVRDLYGSVDSTAQMQAVQGRDFIRQALATAQTTGDLPDSKQLTEAINAAKGGTKEFATQFEKDLEALTLASDLSVMERLTKDQLTEAERMLGIADAQLDSLDGVLELAKQQLDAANGINTSVLSVKDALSTFAAAIATKTVVVPPTGTTPPPVGPRVPTYPTGTGGGGLTVGSTTFASAGGAFGVPLYAVGGGVADADTIAQLIALSSSLPKFADGGMHSGGLRWVGENGPELEATGPSRIWNAQQLSGAMGGGSNNARLEALVEGLTAEVQRLQAIVAQGVTHQRETAEILDNVTEGGNAMRSEVMP